MELGGVPIELNGHLNTNNYFKEQKRRLKNKYQDDLLKLEAQKIYSHLL